MRYSKYNVNSELTQRERDIVRCIVRGMSNREIAELLHITVGTVKLHVHNILRKKDMRGRVDIILEELVGEKEK